MDRVERTVVIGGGSGPSLLARALADRLDWFTAVVCTTDNGSSTGTCRRLFNVPAPGDVRATLSTLASLSGRATWAELWELRLRCPHVQLLDNMALGNMVISGLVQQLGDFAAAIEKIRELLGIRAQVLPVTAESAELAAELTDGTLVVGEREVRRPGKAPIRSLRWFGDPPRPASGVLQAIRRAGRVVLGPGCLFTSLLPCLMVTGVAEAIRKAEGLCVYFCNTTTIPGQTDDFTLAQHVETVHNALGGSGLDAVVANVAVPHRKIIDEFKEVGVHCIQPGEEDIRRIEEMGIAVLGLPLIEEGRSPSGQLHKLDTIRHDPQKIRNALERLPRSEPSAEQ
jgi:uncharacterized cofD-like protein